MSLTSPAIPTGPSVESILTTLLQQGIQVPEGPIRLVQFGDSEALSAELIALIQHGTKRGTCSMLESWQFDGEPFPQAGDIGIVLDYFDRPVMIQRTLHVEITPYNEVSEAFAASEGEGDLSLAYWREAHWDFFSRESERIGRTLDENMPLVCETFEVVRVLS